MAVNHSLGYDIIYEQEQQNSFSCSDKPLSPLKQVLGFDDPVIIVL